MRFILKLKAIKEKEFSYNYNFPLSLELSKLFGFSKPEFYEFLASKEIKLPGKTFNLFSFSLSFENVYRRGKKLYLRSNNASLTVTIPDVIDEFLNNYALNEVTGKHITILKNYPNAILNIKQVDILPQLDITEEEEFTPLSPLVLSSKLMIGQKVVFNTLIYKDDINEINKHLTDNLLFKYKTLYNENMRSGKLQLTWDNSFIEQRLRAGKKLTTKLSVEFGNKKNTILGSLVPFKIKGDRKLIKIGYDCGFGDMNSLGFGITEIAKRNDL